MLPPLWFPRSKGEVAPLTALQEDSLEWAGYLLC